MLHAETFRSLPKRMKAGLPPRRGGDSSVIDEAVAERLNGIYLNKASGLSVSDFSLQYNACLSLRC